jgi:uncharacterized protein YacL
MIARTIFLLVFAAGGFLLGLKEGVPYYGVAWGAGIGVIGLIIEFLFSKTGAGTVLCGLIGLAIGLLFAKMIYYPVKTYIGDLESIYAPLVLDAIFGYSGLLLGLRKGKSLSLSGIVKSFKGIEEENFKIIDTSAIIDGRIADVCDAGFVEGTFILPQFILQELQHIADSADSLKRARGRRGLDVLHKIQKMSVINVKIVDQDFPKIKEVPSSLRWQKCSAEKL